MSYFRKFSPAVLATFACSFAQTPEVSITTPNGPPVVGTLMRPFHLEKRVVAPANLTNTPRLESLVRAGNLYLSVQDVIALVLENNIDCDSTLWAISGARGPAAYPRWWCDPDRTYADLPGTGER